jgi:hypothetical protein
MANEGLGVSNNSSTQQILGQQRNVNEPTIDDRF